MGRDCATCKARKLRLEEEARERELLKNSPKPNRPHFKVGRPSDDLKVTYIPPDQIEPSKVKKVTPLQRRSPKTWSSNYTPHVSPKKSVPRPQTSLAPSRKQIRTRSSASLHIPARCLSQNSMQSQSLSSPWSQDLSPCSSQASLQSPSPKSNQTVLDLKSYLRQCNWFNFDPNSNIPLADYFLPLHRGARQGRSKVTFEPFSLEVQKRIKEGLSVYPTRIPACTIRQRVISTPKPLTWILPNSRCSTPPTYSQPSTGAPSRFPSLECTPIPRRKGHAPIGQLSNGEFHLGNTFKPPSNNHLYGCDDLTIGLGLASASKPFYSCSSPKDFSAAFTAHHSLNAASSYQLETASPDQFCNDDMDSILYGELSLLEVNPLTIAANVPLPKEQAKECFIASCLPLPDDLCTDCFEATCLPLPEDQASECFEATCLPLPEDQEEECFEATCLPLPEDQAFECFEATCLPLPEDQEEECFEATCLPLPEDQEEECFEATCLPLPEDQAFECFEATCLPLPEDQEEECFEATCLPLPEDQEEECFEATCLPLPEDQEEECFEATCLPLPEDQEEECFEATCLPLPEDQEEECFEATCLPLPEDQEKECFEATCLPLPEDQAFECFEATCLPLPEDQEEECFEATCLPLPEDQEEECFEASCMPLPIDQPTECLEATSCPLSKTFEAERVRSSNVSLQLDQPRECLGSTCSPVPVNCPRELTEVSSTLLPDCPKEKSDSLSSCTSGALCVEPSKAGSSSEASERSSSSLTGASALDVERHEKSELDTIHKIPMPDDAGTLQPVLGEIKLPIQLRLNQGAKRKLFWVGNGHWETIKFLTKLNLALLGIYLLIFIFALVTSDGFNLKVTLQLLSGVPGNAKHYFWTQLVICIDLVQEGIGFLTQLF
ncbi:hypothetical protein DSO57_1026346 [Entomophthora muscae]|uniref:Uncharacterized protein n=1 Tax=Entomophthora muscae TaxID=34485 RepID=A0ACC2S3Y3_9FUNG|nr:hypothetical protein DSO57_1026346 [Entomophthora muscae]